ncbi:MAG: metallophosphoesterase [Euzebyales bacterium]|nr:metallophosphoesterase [Euzebyales bacterium]
MTLVAVGDVAGVVARVLARTPGTLALLGDTVYDSGTAQEFSRRYDPAWGRFRDRTRPALGNHDYDTPGAAGYFDYFGASAGRRGRGWYSYDLGRRWHVVVLNSNCEEVRCDDGSAQLAWLRADLQRAQDRNLLAYWHAPRHSSGRHGSAASVAPFWRALYEAHADVVLAGHDHDYERFAPLGPAGEPDERGIRSFVVGTGGRHLYPLAREPLPATEVRNDDSYGVLVLRLSDRAYRWRFVPAMGDFTDSGTAAVVP